MAAFGIIVLTYGVIGSWQAANILDDTLKVGAPTAQNSGWPAPEVPEDIGYKGDPQQAYRYPFEHVTLAGQIGDLPAWLIRSAQESSTAPWAIFVHGIGGRRENGYRFLPSLHQAGLPVLMISYRNDSDAPADPSGMFAFGLTEWQDLDTAVHYAKDNGAPSVILVAESMGGGIVGQFLKHSELAETVSAIVLDAPAIDFEAILTGQLQNMNLPLPAVLSRGALWFSALFKPVHLNEAVATNEFKIFPGPIFLSHGFADSVVPIQSSDHLVSMRDYVTQYLRTDADHIQSWKVDPSRFEANLRAFLATL